MENTPGWNDPPKSCQITNTVGSGAVKLNKRIAFPNSSSKDNSTIKTESAMSSMLCDAGAKPLTGMLFKKIDIIAEKQKTKNTLGRDMNEVQVYSGEGEGGRERACWWRARQSP